MKKVAVKVKSKRSDVRKTTKDHIDQNGNGIHCTGEIPTRIKSGELVFSDWGEFRPNMTPKEVIQAGSFGGTYFHPICSGITKKRYSGVWKELSADWLEGLDIEKQVRQSSAIIYMYNGLQCFLIQSSATAHQTESIHLAFAHINFKRID